MTGNQSNERTPADQRSDPQVEEFNPNTQEAVLNPNTQEAVLDKGVSKISSKENIRPIQHSSPKKKQLEMNFLNQSKIHLNQKAIRVKSVCLIFNN